MHHGAHTEDSILSELLNHQLQRTIFFICLLQQDYYNVVLVRLPLGSFSEASGCSKKKIHVPSKWGPCHCKCTSLPISSYQHKKSVSGGLFLFSSMNLHQGDGLSYAPVLLIEAPPESCWLDVCILSEPDKREAGTSDPLYSSFFVCNNLIHSSPLCRGIMMVFI